MVERQNSNFDCLNNLEEEFGREHASSGYGTGLELGKKAGHDEGYAQGLAEGTKKGAEVGFYRGYAMTWVQLLQTDDSANNTTKSTKILNKLNEIRELADTFPKTNETYCEEKLSKIRVKFKQSTSLLNLKI